MAAKARFVVFAAAVAAASGVAAGAVRAAGLRRGCDHSRPAIAYRPGEGALRPQPSRRLIPCLLVIDQRTSESADVDVLRTGRILYAPLVENSFPAPLDDRGPAKIAASDNGGASWQQIVPDDDNHILAAPPWMPPGVNDARVIAIAAHRVGQIAISYLANTNSSPLLDGWLSQATDALDPHALWWAASLNDPATPLIDTRASTTFGNRLFFNTDSYAPDGEPWAAFHCAFTAPCPKERIGVIGRLASPAPPHRKSQHRRKRHSSPTSRHHLQAKQLERRR